MVRKWEDIFPPHFFLLRNYKDFIVRPQYFDCKLKALLYPLWGDVWTIFPLINFNSHLAIWSILLKPRENNLSEGDDDAVILQINLCSTGITHFQEMGEFREFTWQQFGKHCCAFSFLVAGMMWSECKELWLEGPREYILQLWNVLDFGMLSIFIAAFTARLLAFLQATKAQQYVDNYIEENDLSEVTLPPEIEYFTYGELSFSAKHIWTQGSFKGAFRSLSLP